MSVQRLQAVDYPCQNLDQSAGFSGTIQQTLVQRSPGLQDLFCWTCSQPPQSLQFSSKIVTGWC